MEKSKKSIILSVLCGVVVCFMCLGVVFLLPAKNKSELNNKDNNNLNEEINLGDTSGCAATALYCPSGYSGYNEYVCASSRATSQPPCGAGTIIMQDGCHTTANKITGCYGCKEGYSASGYDCVPDPTPDPTPEPPAPTCSKSRCDLCGTLSACVVVSGCYWYNNTCSNNPTPTPKPTATPTPAPVTCWHANGTNTGCVSGSYSTCSNDPELYSSESACISALPKTPTPRPTATPVPTPTATPTPNCSPGYYYDFGMCVKCPSGAFCEGDDSIYLCPLGTYQNEKGASSCKPCEGNTYSLGGATKCIDCGSDKANSTHTACQNSGGSAPCSAGYWRGQYGCEICPAGYYCDGSTKTMCSGNFVSTKTGLSYCTFVCPPGTEPNANHTYCYDCSGNTISTDGARCVSCASDEEANEAHTKCVKKAPVCYCTGDFSDCTLSSYQPEDNYLNKFSSITDASACYAKERSIVYTVTFFYADTSGRFTHKCKTNENGEGINEATCEVNHIWCGQYSPNACIGDDCKDGIGQNRVGAVDVAVLKNQKYSSDAEYHCVAGTSGGPVIATPTPTPKPKPTPTLEPGTTPAPTATPAPTPTPTPKPVVYKCYIDENDNYHWSSTPENSWIIARGKDGSEITNVNLCPPVPACYTDTNGKYIWGEYSTKPGYSYHAEIDDENSCKESDEYGCYKKGHDYVWAKVPPSGYTHVNVSFDKCEEPACYYQEKEQKRIWGYYSKVNGYYKIVDENDNEIPFDRCINEACYLCDGKDYVWGDYSADPVVCKIIPSVTNMSQCNNEVPVKSTGVSISAIVYTFVAILMAFGIGFIYYSSVKKNDN